MTNYLRRLSRTGVTDEMSERDAGHVVVLNVVVLLVFFIAIQFMSLTAAYLPATWIILVCMALHTLSIGPGGRTTGTAAQAVHMQDLDAFNLFHRLDALG